MDNSTLRYGKLSDLGWDRIRADIGWRLDVLQAAWEDGEPGLSRAATRAFIRTHCLPSLMEFHRSLRITHPTEIPADPFTFLWQADPPDEPTPPSPAANGKLPEETA